MLYIAGAECRNFAKLKLLASNSKETVVERMLRLAEQGIEVEAHEDSGQARDDGIFLFWLYLIKLWGLRWCLSLIYASNIGEIYYKNTFKFVGRKKITTIRLKIIEKRESLLGLLINNTPTPWKISVW